MSSTERLHDGPRFEGVSTTDFGAVGDGVHNDTAAIQRAVDECSLAGGGRVVVPAGRFLIGTVHLRDHIDLHLAAGATLLASPNRGDYNPDDCFPDRFDDRIQDSGRFSAAHLITAYRARHVSITGSGTIDGNSSAFYSGDASLPYRYRIRLGERSSEIEWRPGEMIWFCRCHDIAVRDVHLLNAPFFTVFLVGCEDGHVRGVTIDNPATSWNADGLGIDGSRNITVSDCVIRSGDDCITLKSGETVHPAHRFADGTEVPNCENVVVTNCVLSTPCNAVRIGTGAGGSIRDCRLSNIVVRDTNNGILIHPHYDGGDVRISGISFSGWTLDCTVPFRVIDNGLMRNLTFEALAERDSETSTQGPLVGDVHLGGMQIRSSRPGEIIGARNCPIERVVLRDIDWEILPDPRLDELLEEGAFVIPQTVDGETCAFVGAYLEACRLERVRVRWRESSTVPDVGFDVRHGEGLELRGVVVDLPEGAAGEAVRLTDCSNVDLAG